MSENNVAIPQGATIAPDQPQTQTQTQPQPQAVPIPSDAVVQNEGEQINDVGNRVIVPKDGESFSDTMKRAADYGKTVTPKQIDAEVATMPKKAATVLAAAPLIGAAIPAAETGLAELPGAGKVIFDHLEKKAAQYVTQYPHLIGFAKAMGIPTTTAGVLLYAHHLFGKDK